MYRVILDQYSTCGIMLSKQEFYVKQHANDLLVLQETKKEMVVSPEDKDD